MARCAAGCGPIHPVESAPPPKPVVKIAIMPRYSPYTMTKRYMPLVKYLRQETGYDISYVSAVGYRGFLSAVERADADLVFVNPMAYVTLQKTRGAYPLVIAVEPDFAGGVPRTRYRGVILTRANSGITRIADLKGKIIATGSEMAVAGYLAPKALCRQEGLDIDQDATITVCPTQEDVIKRLRQGRVQVGFVREAIWQEAVTSGSPSTELRPIAYTMMFPGWCVCALGDTDESVAQTAKEALLKLDWSRLQSRTVLGQAGLRGFVEADDEEYGTVRHLLQSLRMPY